MPEAMPVAFDYYARWSFDRFRLLQPHVETDGLWKFGDRYYIKCSDLSLPPLETDISKPLTEHFQYSIRPAGTPIELCEQVPEGAVRVNERTMDEVSSVRGVPLTATEVYILLAAELHPEFPLVSLVADGVTLVFQVSRSLNGIEAAQVSGIMGNLSIVPDYRIEVVDSPTVASPSGVVSRDSLTIVPSRLIRANISADLRQALESDEQVWRVNRNAVLHGDPSINQYYSSDGQGLSKCLVNASVMAPNNIRNYLSLFDTVYLVVPLQDNHLNCSSNLGASEDELIQLIEMGRLKLLCPQSVTRYNLSFLERAVEANSTSVTFSRRLSAMTILDSRARNPLPYPPLSVNERAIVLNAMYKAANEGPNGLRNLYRLLTLELSQVWSSAEEFINTRGAMATASLGNGRIVGALIQGLTGRDVRLETFNAAMSIEWAGAMGAILCPTGDPLFVNNEVRLANIVSGANLANNTFQLMEHANMAVGDILTIGRHVPVVEFARAFSSSDINRFRRLLQKMSEHKATIEELQESIARFNQDVIRYDYQSTQLSRWDIQGVVLEGVLNSIDHNFPFSRLVLEVIKIAIEHAARHSTSAHQVQDTLVALNAGVVPDAVLVSRMQRNLRNSLF